MCDRVCCYLTQVYEEKRQNWAMEVKELQEEWDRRFRAHQQKAFKTEQALLLQVGYFSEILVEYCAVTKSNLLESF